MDGRNEVESGVISRVALKRSRTHVEKGVAWAILALSWVGTVATANGGWESLLTTFSLGATVAAIPVLGTVSTLALRSTARLTDGCRLAIRWLVQPTLPPPGTAP